MTSDCYRLSGSGELVLMLHSSMSSKGQWKALAERLSTKYQVLALDLTGYGGAAYPSDEATYSLHSEGAHIDQVLRELGFEGQDLHVIGHSFGGATALHWTYHNQARVKSLHLFEPVAFHLLEEGCAGAVEIGEVVRTLDGYLEAGDQQSACAHFINYWSGAGAFEQFPEHIQQAMIAQVPKVLLDFQALRGAELTLQDYAKLPMKKTLIKGTQSPLSSRTIALSLKDVLTELDFHEVECGHMGPITHAKMVNEVLEEKFL